MNLQNKVVVITGGASGLGQATARFLVQEKGAKVALLDMNEAAGKETVDELGGANAAFYRVDVTVEQEVDSALDAIIGRFGAIHADINAAGIPLPFKLLDKEGKASGLQKFRSVVNINLIGLFTVMAKCAERMSLNEPDEKGERGVIVNISSGAAFEGQIGQCGYSASKAGVNGLNMPAARELGPLGIRVNSIAPGLFATPMINSLNPKVQEALTAMCEAPKRMGEMEEFAMACTFLIENSYMNGRTIRLDAATTMQAK
ncbi:MULTISPECIES: SDR family NAD(P)-dependent oxidoreductase [Pseudomonadaceae]|uniref:SDR family NAD(P)-dependent oxidoreductase n=1 Tax=Stutzerimonas chloritidismutans TaxID=203192 RepID=A0ACC5VQ60_STUCH|nr:MULTISPECIES: SDR family NAD(P)-dependent oxidoreductase [Pseudomonadaceae]MBT1079827.1 SDR family NAD(P)-dependent oxidoreductase [Pseudomonas aeruginosa]MBX7274273.1 SDR family NAD(P)-dependent oxidoreductase [Stutzerimonas chloritidismutans]MCS7968333.1 SDR family NAD(P)-dependent oxidoreductase [Pseudomonas aeruginosa]MCS8136981.1 SDR family NAD(P)-dependent oxidoreductase [Pseudomonas aeruginosa]MCS8179014.1 SDR family NAD(P)-dependent oxidoreductase [Pseudomonas aeruginosa]